MKLFQTFTFVILLLSCYQAGASACLQKSDFSYDNLITAEVSGDFQEQFQSTLTILSSGGKNFFSKNQDYCNFIILSHLIAREAENYICHSLLISPGLGLPEIIFPFHSFP